MKSKINLYVVRHGETYLNKYKKLQGWADCPLTEEGKESAIQSGKKLENVPFTRVYTSDLRRTVETAKLILQQNYYNKNLKINKRKAFREVFFGSYEGDYLEAALRKIMQDNGYDYHTVKEVFRYHCIEEVLDFTKKSDPFHHAENYRELWARIEKGLNEIISNGQSINENILLVSHGILIRNMINRFMYGDHFKGEVKNASVSVLEYSNSTFKVVSFNI